MAWGSRSGCGVKGGGTLPGSTLPILQHSPHLAVRWTVEHFGPSAQIAVVLCSAHTIGAHAAGGHAVDEASGDGIL